MPSPLAPPFNTLFRDRAEADWAFNLLRQTLTALGVDDPANERFVLSLPLDENALRLNFGKWNVLGFKGDDEGALVEMALFQGETDVRQIKEAAAYAYRNSDPEVAMHQNLPLKTVQKWPGNLRLVFEDTLAFVANRFGNWKRSNFRNAHVPALAEAVFDLEKRAQLFEHGFPETELLFDDEDLSPNGETGGAGTFTPQTFTLLDGLHADPTKAFYQGQRDEFRTYLEDPFKQLLSDVAGHLPWSMKSVLETQTRVISRILKNDFGRGGAWDHYWGAFYPKGSNRLEDAQFSMWVNHEMLRFGFYIGDHADQVRQRFVHNCQQHQGIFLELLATAMPSGLHFGTPDTIEFTSDGTVIDKEIISLADWLANPARWNFDAKIVISSQELLQIAYRDLISLVADTFTRLFPFFLLAILDDPLPAIKAHLQHGEPASPVQKQEYPLSSVAEATGFDEIPLAGFVRALERKKQAILYGPPGTGKTYLAEHLARHLVSGGDGKTIADGFVELVQFHPSYAYEDFVMGLRPLPSPGRKGVEGEGWTFDWIPGRFLDFCARARTRSSVCVLIIDEINRADLSRVFGELMVLLEYRDREITLASGQPFRIPDNVRIIGTMNTADRSIALVDFALRRRFAFLALPPDFDVLRRYHARHETGFPMENLITLLQRINAAIEDPNFALGQSFFLRPNLSDEIEDIWRTEIEPYLEEYFFDQPETVEAFRWERVGGAYR